MILLTPAQRAALRANAAESERTPGHDPAPVVKLFNPAGPATWLASEPGRDGDTLFGLADLGFGCPELGRFSLAELARLRLPFGLAIERDLFFETAVPLSAWADTAHRTGSIPAAEIALRARERARRTDRLPPPDRGGG